MSHELELLYNCSLYFAVVLQRFNRRLRSLSVSLSKVREQLIFMEPALRYVASSIWTLVHYANLGED